MLAKTGKYMLGVSSSPNPSHAAGETVKIGRFWATERSQKTGKIFYFRLLPIEKSRLEQAKESNFVFICFAFVFANLRSSRGQAAVPLA
jgi:hypothetical protein